MVEMTIEEIRSFLRRGTFTGKLATTRKDASPHVAPVWFVLDEDSNNTDIIFTTWHESLKAKNIIRDPRARISIDDQIPPFSFVIINGVAEISEEPNDLLKWATKIAERYVGPDKSEAYGRRNSVKGELLIRVKPKNIIEQKDVAGQKPFCSVLTIQDKTFRTSAQL